MNTSPTTLGAPVLWQPERHLADDDRIVVLTDIQIVWSRYYDFSPEQELFRVGVYDATTGKIGFVKFGRDLAFDMLKGGVPLPSWGTAALPFGIELHRRSHGVRSEGRFRGNVTLFPVEHSVLALAAVAQKRFRQEGHSPNTSIGMWTDLQARAKSELAIEEAALDMPGAFQSERCQSGCRLRSANQPRSSEDDSRWATYAREQEEVHCAIAETCRKGGLDFVTTSSDSPS